MAEAATRLAAESPQQAKEAKRLAADSTQRADELEEEEDEEEKEEKKADEKYPSDEEEKDEEDEEEQPRPRGRNVPLASQSSDTSSSPPPAKKPKLQKGQQVPRGLTNPILIAIEHRLHLQLYYSIANKLIRAKTESDNAAWAEAIQSKFEVSCTAHCPKTA